MPSLKILLALGTLSHGEVLRALGLKKGAFKFAHGALHALPDGKIFTNSYHCSRYNTNTGLLTEKMLDDIFAVRPE